jgi:hypothetical protein
MICARCGTEKIENANYCIKCGYKFSIDPLEEQKDNYLINYGLSTLIGVLTGLITGIFSAAFSQLIHLDFWGWIIILVSTCTGIGWIIYTSYRTLEDALIRQKRRRL